MSSQTPIVEYYIRAMSEFTRLVLQKTPIQRGVNTLNPCALWTTAKNNQVQSALPSYDQVAYIVRLPPPKVLVAAKLPSMRSQLLSAVMCKLKQEHTFSLPVQYPPPWKASKAAIKHTWITESVYKVISLISPVISYLLKDALIPLAIELESPVPDGIKFWTLSVWMQLFWSRQQSTIVTGAAGLRLFTLKRVTSVSAQF